MKPEATLDGELVLHAPASVNAGEPVTVVVERVDAPNGLVATLLAAGSYGALLYRAPFEGGRAEFQIPARDTRVAGMATLRAQAGAAEGYADLTIAPGDPVDPVTPLVGPRTLIADGAHWGTALAIPFDSYGNPVAEGTPVEFRVQRPDASAEIFRIPVAHMLAWRRISSATHAGRTTVTVTTGNAHGPDASLVETPGWPASFTLSAAPISSPADGRQLITLRTTSIVDRFGNQMLDGTLVTFVVEPPGGAPRFIPAYTIDGVAEAQLQAPTEPGTVAIRATLYGIESASLKLDFTPGPAVGAIPVEALIYATTGTFVVEAGPLLADSGQFVPDGTVVRFTLIGPDGAPRHITGEAVGGKARIELPLADVASGDYLVEADVGAGHGQAAFRVP